MTLFDEMPVKFKQVSLRDYQSKQIAETHELLKTHRRVMYQSPTGSGKSVVMGEFVRYFNSLNLRTISFAHRDELVSGLQDKYLAQYNIRTGRIQANYKEDYSLWHQVASIPSYIGRMKNKLFPADVILIDEGHHALADGYIKIMAAYPNATILAFTATPYRLSGAGFTKHFDAISIGPSILDLEILGELMPAKVVGVTISSAEMSKLHLSKGDYNEKELADMMMETSKIMSIVDTYIELGENKQAIIFAVNREHSIKIMEAFRFRGINAVHVDGETDKVKRYNADEDISESVRDSIFRKFETKEIRVLCNVDIAGEGNDIAGIEYIGDAAPTKSLSRFKQRVGRGVRKNEKEGKKFYTYADHANNVFEHGMPNAYIDWNEHFVGIKKGEKKKKKYDQEGKQFKLRLEDGTEFISSLEKLPKNFKGVILSELDMNEYMQEDLIDEFEGLWNYAKVVNYKPMWCFHSLVKYCAKEGKRLPSDAALGKMAGLCGYGQGWIVKQFGTIASKYNL